MCQIDFLPVAMTSDGRSGVFSISKLKSYLCALFIYQKIELPVSKHDEHANLYINKGHYVICST